MSTVDILLCNPGAELYGSDRMAVETVRAAVAAGYSVRVALPGDGPAAAHFAEAGGDILLAPAPALRKTLLSPRGLLRLAASFPPAVIRARRVVRDSGARVVVVNTLIQPTWVIGAWLARVPVVVHVREAEVGGRWLQQRALHAPLQLAAAVIANSDSTRAHIIHNAPGTAGRTTTIYNGKSWDDYFVSPFDGIGSTPRLLFTGRLSPRKGVDVAIAAVALMREAGTPANLVIAGSVFPGYEWYERDLRDQVARTDMQSNVQFVGFVDTIAELLAESDLVLVPSRVEPFGTVAAEAMAAERPVVVSQVSGLLEIVADSVTGLTVPADDARALADACLRLIREPQLAATLATAGREHVLTSFSSERYETAVVEVIRTAMRPAPQV